MSDAGYTLHPDAARDIFEIWEYVSADNVLAAQKLREEFLESIRSLSRFPGQGHFRPDITNRGYRFQRVRDYLVAYVAEERPILVLGVVHGRRNPRVISN